jgi:hypothetical protein
VQLFDDLNSLAEAVSAFLLDGFAQGDTLLVVSRHAQWRSIAAQLREAGVPVDDIARSGQLTVRDAADTLKRFMPVGRVDAGLFDRSVGALVRELAFRGKPLRIYGEMVDLLALDADFRAAQRLEELWNELGERQSLTLFCGYSAVNFGDPRTAEALRRICDSHSHVRSNPRDLLGSFLLRTHAPAEATG